ncbi:Grx4 family monothiol glutaredoxin [Engelhardtia mirabilis]|uniref:Glutaredoxin n=1 Tax=Engelhardtia mirabilis TaxID=2528011 RepID=A0A518BNP9_9BACT|nr:Glutaredoxin-4 [Planctomycetes bacterium Pla133]QDV02912.1 Glutaredoxin-4 [Planctomycetes bacterium Pla86]
MWNKDKVEETVKADKVVLFAKGSRFQPMCGFSAKAMDILSRYTENFTVVNIFDDENIRPSLISFSNWPTTPQLFIDGEFIGGSDIMEELMKNGELETKLKATGAV